MSLIRLHSEPYGRDGNLAADGAARLLGQPALSPLELLIRETLQNSWDASLGCEGSPVFRIRVRRLKSDQLEAMREFFSELPPSDAGEPVSGQIRHFLDSPDPLVMEICDEGTKGLGGPVSASEALDKGAQADFVNFVRNIGSPRDIALGGGTYGFGKSSLFKVSGCSTIIIHSLTGDLCAPEHRLIGMALGKAFDHDGRRYTGRHWWGARSDDESGSVDPLTGEGGSGRAEALGFIPRPTHQQRGTSLMILDPSLEDLVSDTKALSIFGSAPSRQRLISRIQDILLWHCWPKFTRHDDGSIPMQCRLSILGEDIDLPDPATIQPLWLLTEALREARLRKDEVWCERPRMRIGFFGQSTASVQMPGDDRFRVHLGEGALIPEKLSHMALLRPAELVVRYEVGSLNESEQSQWAGVYVCDEGPDHIVEQAYARSEPPAHDDWQPRADQTLSSHQRTFVNVGLRRIKERVKRLSGTDLARSVQVSQGEQESLAALAGQIGRVLIGSGPGGSSGRSSSGGGGGGPRPVRLSVPEALGTALENGEPVATFRVRLTGLSDQVASVSLTPYVLSDFREKDVSAPNGRAPEVVRVTIDDVTVPVSASLVDCRANGKGSEIMVAITVPDYVAVGLTADLVDREEP
jgi:hypothetical protein